MTRPTLQLISAEVVTLCYFPGITRELSRKHPNLQCSTESGGEEQIQRLLREGEVNLAIAPEHEGWRGFQRAPLLELRPVLICPEKLPFRSAREVWALPEPPAPLLVSAASDTVTRSFNAGLKGLGVKWPQRRRVASALCVSQQVADGDGFGLTVDVPNLVRRPGIRVLTLANFQPVTLAAFWRGKPTVAHDSAITLMRATARELQAR